MCVCVCVCVCVCAVAVGSIGMTLGPCCQYFLNMIDFNVRSAAKHRNTHTNPPRGSSLSPSLSVCVCV